MRALSLAPQRQEGSPSCGDSESMNTIFLCIVKGEPTYKWGGVGGYLMGGAVCLDFQGKGSSPNSWVHLTQALPHILVMWDLREGITSISLSFFLCNLA